MKRKLGIFLAVIMLFASIAFVGCDWFAKKELKNATYIQTSFKVYNDGGEIVGEQSYNKEEALAHGDGLIFDVANNKLRLFQNNQVELAEQCEYTVDGVDFQFHSNMFGMDIQGKVVGKDKIEITMNDEVNKQVHKAILENFGDYAYALYNGKYKVTKYYDGQGVEQDVNYYFDFNDNYTQLRQYNSADELIGTYDIARGFNLFTFADTEYNLTVKVTLESNKDATAKVYDANGNLNSTIQLTIKPENSGSEN